MCEGAVNAAEESLEARPWLSHRLVDAPHQEEERLWTVGSYWLSPNAALPSPIFILLLPSVSPRDCLFLLACTATDVVTLTAVDAITATAAVTHTCTVRAQR